MPPRGSSAAPRPELSHIWPGWSTGQPSSGLHVPIRVDIPARGCTAGKRPSHAYYFPAQKQDNTCYLPKYEMDVEIIKREDGASLMLPPLSLTWKALNPDAQLWKIFFQQQHLPPWQALQASCLGSSAVASWSITWICYCGLSGCLVRAEANSFWFTFESKKLHFCFAPFFLCSKTFSDVIRAFCPSGEKMVISFLTAFPPEFITRNCLYPLCCK